MNRFALSVPMVSALAIALGLAVHATTASAQTAKVDRLATPEPDRTEVANAVGANVYQRLALDEAVTDAATRLGAEITQSCAPKTPIVLFLETATLSASSVHTARAAQTASLKEIKRITDDIDLVSRRIDAFSAAARAPSGSVSLSVSEFARVAPAVTDLVRVVDSIRFVVALTQTQYAFTAVTGTPSPGLLENTLLKASSAYRLGDPLRDESDILNAFDKAEEALVALEGKFAAASLLATTDDRKKAIAALAEEVKLVRSQLIRYTAPGKDNTPSPLQQLVAADYALPGKDACLVSYTPSVDATIITSQRVVFPTRKFDIDARAVIVASVFKADFKAPARLRAEARCTLEVTPRDRSGANPTCDEEATPSNGAEKQQDATSATQAAAGT